MRSIAPRMEGEARQRALELLPGTLNVIWRMAILPGGHLAVWRITSLESVELDIFDRDGRFTHTLLPSAEIPDLRDVEIFGDSIGVTTELEDRTVFVEYRVRNPKGIFEGF